MTNDLELHLYKIVIEPLLSKDQTEKIGQLNSDKFFEKKTPLEFSFRMRSFLILMMSVTLKMIECWQ